jgi:RNA polymerase sigma-70 factor (ECF subfamily)
MNDTPVVEDSVLVARCQAELPYNTTAFEALVRRYESSVFEVCVRYLGVREDAEEVTQDTFSKVFRGLHQFESRSTFRTWLFRIANNECASRYRKIRRRRQVGEEYERDQRAEAQTSKRAGALEPAFGESVEQALDALADTDREILLLRYSAELSFEEMAEALGIGLSAAKMRLYRAEDRFRAAHGSATIAL